MCEGIVKVMVYRLRGPCRGDKSAGFEHGAVIRETVDDVV